MVLGSFFWFFPCGAAPASTHDQQFPSPANVVLVHGWTDTGTKIDALMVRPFAFAENAR